MAKSAPNLKTVDLTVRVQVPKTMSARNAADLIADCIAIGMADAADTSEDPGLDNPAADEALSINVLSVKPERKKTI